MTGRTPARLLAPIALVATAVALLLILASGGGEDGTSAEPGASAPAPTTTTGTTTTTTDRRERRGRRTYTVRPGDTPSAIAEEVGIPLEELLDLNPEVDPQSLTPGQKLRLR